MEQWHLAKRSLTWTGRGASLALAEVISATFRHRGVAAWAAAPEDVAGPTAWVSRRGTAEGRAEVLLTEHPGPNDRIVVHCNEPADAWFPAGWQMAVLESLASAFGEELPTIKPPSPGVLVVSAGASAVATLLDAAADKLGARPWLVTTPGDFGHGAFARVIVERLPVHILGRADDVEKWARTSAQVHTQRVPIPPTCDLPPMLLAYTWALLGIAEISKGVNRPFPDEFDTFRR